MLNRHNLPFSEQGKKTKVHFEITKYREKIYCYLIPGVYVLERSSATGKTRLYNLLEQYRKYGLPVSGYTYYDYTQGIKLLDKVRLQDKLIMIDRYGLYNTEFAEEIAELSKKSVILIDCKSIINSELDFRVAYIGMTENVLEIW